MSLFVGRERKDHVPLPDLLRIPQKRHLECAHFFAILFYSQY